MEARWAHNPEVSRSKLPPDKFFSRISERKEIETVTSQINKREFGNIYTTVPQKNHKTRSTVFIKPRGQQGGAVEECWAHNPEVGRSKLTPANFFQGFHWRGHRNSYLTSQRERIRQNVHYIVSEEPQYEV